MRQLFNWRFVAALAALAVLALVARAVLGGDDAIESVTEPEVIERQIDLIDPIAAATLSPEFGIDRNGVSTGFLDLALDEQRALRIVPGTYGELGCDSLAVPTDCAIFADLLGEAVVWFAILPKATPSTVELPPILDLVDGQAVFESGWRIPYASVIERDCEGQEIPTFGEFLRDFSENSTTIVDLTSREVVAVRCAATVDG